MWSLAGVCVGVVEFFCAQQRLVLQATLTFRTLGSCFFVCVRASLVILGNTFSGDVAVQVDSECSLSRSHLSA